MKFQFCLCILFVCKFSFSQVVLNADGPGNTYALINSVFAPGYNVVEAPDCSHTEFGNHIDEIFDNDLNTNVFRFFIHTTPDNDRCIKFDRQRNEIKTYDKSPDNLKGVEGELVIYKWKFKLESGFQSSSSFTHLHQLKSVGGDLASMPMYTLTTRKGSPDQLELRYAETDKQITLLKQDLTPFIGVWLNVTETISYGASGSYEIEINKDSDGTSLFTYANNSIVNWRHEASFVRPKWGIYRSLNNAQDLRDEQVLFADFSIEESDVMSVNDIKAAEVSFAIKPNPIRDEFYVSEIPKNASYIEIFTMDGRNVLKQTVDKRKEVKLDVSSFADGTYVLSVVLKEQVQSKLIVISK